MSEPELDAIRLRSIPEVKVVLERVANEPLFDAAYELYRLKSSLDERDAGLSPSSPEHFSHTVESGHFGRVFLLTAMFQ